MAQANPITLEDILQRTRSVGDCRVWTGTIASGCALLYDRDQGKQASVRLIVWNLAHPDNKVESGKPLRSTCGTTACINPEHLALKSDGVQPARKPEPVPELDPEEAEPDAQPHKRITAMDGKVFRLVNITAGYPGPLPNIIDQFPNWGPEEFNDVVSEAVRRGLIVCATLHDRDCLFLASQVPEEAVVIEGQRLRLGKPVPERAETPEPVITPAKETPAPARLYGNGAAKPLPHSPAKEPVRRANEPVTSSQLDPVVRREADALLPLLSQGRNEFAEACLVLLNHIDFKTQGPAAAVDAWVKVYLAGRAMAPAEDLR